MKASSIRWDEVRARLVWSEEALREAFSENPERVRAVYRQRAERLALAATNQPASKRFHALAFRLGEERYAIPLSELAEVLPFRGCTPVPRGAPQFLGVINLRGEIRPVVGLARLISGDSPSRDSGALLILRRAGALKVDGVEHLCTLSSAELQRPTEGQYLQALAPSALGPGLLGLLDVERIVAAAFPPERSKS